MHVQKWSGGLSELNQETCFGTAALKAPQPVAKNRSDIGSIAFDNVLGLCAGKNIIHLYEKLASSSLKKCMLSVEQS